MNIHKNASLTPIGRERLVRQVESGQTPETAARSAGVCSRTVRKWLAWFRGRGRGWATGSLVAAAPVASPDPGRDGGADRGVAAPALHRRSR